MKLNTLPFSKVIITSLFLSMMSPTVYARTDKLVEPAPVTLNCNLSENQMQSGIRNGGAVRGWSVANQAPGNTQLNYIKGDNKHSLTVNVSYTPNTFSITYKDSNNLDYVVKNGVRRIHPKPITWMSNLSEDIQRFTNNECLGQ